MLRKSIPLQLRPCVHPLARNLQRRTTNTPSNLKKHPPRVPLLRGSVDESIRPSSARLEKTHIPRLPSLSLEEFQKRQPGHFPRAPDRRQYLRRRLLAWGAEFAVTGIDFGLRVGFVELQSLSAGTVDTGAGGQERGSMGKSRVVIIEGGGGEGG